MLYSPGSMCSEGFVTHLWPCSKSKLNLKSDRVNLVAPASPIECLLYLPSTVQTGTGQVDPARKFKCTAAAAHDSNLSLFIHTLIPVEFTHYASVHSNCTAINTTFKRHKHWFLCPRWTVKGLRGMVVIRE